ncbi:MAG TPA: hypothetical protein VFY23_09420 [Candidatus Limnocylindrales bacterium]|nr:hypothetical protein [Candidatus Limnocylindrales bacterium]
MFRARSVLAALAAAFLFVSPVTAAGATSHVRLADRIAFVWATTYPADGNVEIGTVYRDTYVQVNDKSTREGGDVGASTLLSVEVWAFTVDRGGDIVTRSITNLDVSGPAVLFSMDRQLTEASVAAVASGSRTTYARNGSTSEEPVSAQVSGTWTSAGDMWRGYSFNHATGGAVVTNIHYRGRGRDDVRFTGAVDGIDVGRTYSGMLSDQLQADLFVTRGGTVTEEATDAAATGRSALDGARMTGGTTMGYWSTYPEDGSPVPDVEYVDTQVYVSTDAGDPVEGFAPQVVVRQDRYTVDAEGGWHGVSSSMGVARGEDVVVTIDRTLSAASVRATIDLNTCTTDGCLATRVPIDATWLGQGPLTRLVQNERLVAGDLIVHRHARETSRDATATMTLAGVAAGDSSMAIISANADWSFVRPR